MYQHGFHTVFLMHLRYLPCISSALDDIVVKFVPKCDGSELWPRKFSKRTEIEAIYSHRDTINKNGAKSNQKAGS